MGLTSLLTTIGVALSCAAPGAETAAPRALPGHVETPDITLIAHRAGMVPGIPENSLAAIRNAVATGVDGIEIDLRQTRDEHIVVMHDRTLRRTTNGRGWVGRRKLAAIRDLTFRAAYLAPAEAVPSYAEALDLVQRSKLQLVLDVKATLKAEPLARALRKRGLLGRSVIGSRSPRALARYRRAAPEARLLGLARSRDHIDDFIVAGADIIRLKPAWLNSDAVSALHQRQQLVWVTAGDPDRRTLCALAGASVDGILIDRPDRVVRAN